MVYNRFANAPSLCVNTTTETIADFKETLSLLGYGRRTAAVEVGLACTEPRLPRPKRSFYERQWKNQSGFLAPFQVPQVRGGAHANQLEHRLVQ